MKRTFLIGVLSICYALNTNANANENKNNYLKIGTNFAHGELMMNFDGSITSFSNKEKINTKFPSINLGIGKKCNNMEYYIGISHKEYDKSKKEKIKIFTTSFDLNYLFKNNSKIIPYAGIGLNVYNFDIKIGTVKDKTTGTSFAFKTGLRANLNKNLDLDFNIQQTTKVDCFKKYVYVGSPSNIGTLKTEYSEISANIGLLFRF